MTILLRGTTPTLNEEEKEEEEEEERAIKGLLGNQLRIEMPM